MPRQVGPVKKEFSKFSACLYKMLSVTRILLYWIVSVAGLVAAAWISGSLGLHVHADLDHPVKLFLGVAILGIVNATIGNILKGVSILLIVLTLGAFAVLINAALFLWVGSFEIGFTVGGFIDALVCSLIMNVLVQVVWRAIR